MEGQLLRLRRIDTTADDCLNSFMFRFLRHFIFTLSLFLTWIFPAHTADFYKGLEAYNQSDYATALNELKPLAEQGNTDAQFALALMYDNGQGVEQSDEIAFKWYIKSADQGDAIAQYIVGEMYKWGRGIVQDYAKAVEWHTKSSERGNIFAQYSLANLYRKGEGVLQNYIIAHMWANLAATNNNNDKQSKSIKKISITLKDKIDKFMTPEQIAKAQDRATRCHKNDYKDC